MKHKQLLKLRKLFGLKGVELIQQYNLTPSPYFHRIIGASFYSPCGNYRLSDHWNGRRTNFQWDLSKRFVLAKKEVIGFLRDNYPIEFWVEVITIPKYKVEYRSSNIKLSKVQQKLEEKRREQWNLNWTLLSYEEKYQ